MSPTSLCLLGEDSSAKQHCWHDNREEWNVHPGDQGAIRGLCSDLSKVSRILPA